VRSDAWCSEEASFNPACRWCVDGCGVLDLIKAGRVVRIKKRQYDSLHYFFNINNCVLNSTLEAYTTVWQTSPWFKTGKLSYVILSLNPILPIFSYVHNAWKIHTSHRIYSERTYVKFYMTHDPCIIRKYTIIIPTNAQKYINKISLYTQWTPTCFGQPCGHLQGYKIQSLDTIKVYN
jgi:hypothetical protein